MRHEQTVYRCMVSGARRLQAAVQYGGGVAVLVGVLWLPLVAAVQETAAALAVLDSAEPVEAVAMGAPRAGDLDTSFGGTGKVFTAVDDESIAWAVAIQPDGKIVVAGRSQSIQGSNQSDFALARYRPDGTLDSSFSGDGKVTTDFGGEDEARALAIQPDGKIVVAGGSQSSYPDPSGFALARYRANGTLDPTFGTGGRVITDFGPGVNPPAVALTLQPDGKIVAAGGRAAIALARYLPDGTLDPTFNGGTVETYVSGLAEAHALALQPDGKLVVAGVGFEVDGSDDFVLARYRPDGTLDPTFGSGGIVLTDFTNGSRDRANALALQPDGKLIVAGWSCSDTGCDFALARYHVNGALDTSFSGDGKVTTDLGGSAGAFALALQPDGKIVVAGDSSGDGCYTSNFALARYHVNGSLDTTFSGEGTVLTDVGNGSNDSAFALAIQPRDGRLVLAGISSTTSGDRFALARYHAHTCGGVVVTRINARSHTTIMGTSGNDVIFDFGHDNRIYGLGGNDNICSIRGSVANFAQAVVKGQLPLSVEGI